LPEFEDLVFIVEWVVLFDEEARHKMSGLLGFIGLFGFVELGIKVFYEAGTHLGDFFGLGINFLKQAFLYISLIKSYIQMTLDLRR